MPQFTSIPWLQLHWSDYIKTVDISLYNTLNNICANQIQLSVFSMKILAGKGNHRHFLSNTYYKHKYFAATIFTSLPTFGIKYPFFLLTSPGFTAGTKRINSCSTTGGRNATNIIHLLIMEVNFIRAFLL